MNYSRTAREPTWVELESIIPLAAADGSTSVESVANLSPDTQQRRYPELIVKLSLRRRGMKLKHALAIADGTYRPSAAALATRRAARMPMKRPRAVEALDNTD